MGFLLDAPTNIAADRSI